MIKIFIFFVLLREGRFNFVPEKHKNWNLLPHDTCGQVSTNRIIGGEVPKLGAYPWLARVGHFSEDELLISFFCGGLLVNFNTILTAAHCTEVGGVEINVVRLGEYNANTDPDCDEGYCADPVLDVRVSNVIVHSEYDGKLFLNDIGILWLSEKVKFSAFVSPICIGGSDFMRKNFVGTIGEVAGWGIYDINKAQLSDLLQYVKVPVMNSEKCFKYFRKYFNKEKNFCAGGVVGEDSCSGDSGGPLMIVDDGLTGPSYFILGIVSFGATDCGATALPGVYTNVSYYLEWFLDNLNPSSEDQ